jgi:hypothetical protein
VNIGPFVGSPDLSLFVSFLSYSLNTVSAVVLLKYVVFGVRIAMIQCANYSSQAPCVSCKDHIFLQTVYVEYLCCLLHAGFLCGLLFSPNNGYIFLRNTNF